MVGDVLRLLSLTMFQYLLIHCLRNSENVRDSVASEVDGRSPATPLPPPVRQQRSVCEQGGPFRSATTRSVLLEKVTTGLWGYVPLSCGGSLVECVEKCLLTQLCCHIRYDSRRHLCSWLRSETDYPEVDCADEECYRIDLVSH